MENQTVIVTGITNREFIERYAQPGRVGLCGGITKIDSAIRLAQRHLHAERRWSDWSHAFLFEGKRVDGQHWVLESDLQILRKNIQLGVQENRADKYFDEKMFPTLAVLDFGLSETQIATLLREGLELVASRERYSLCLERRRNRCCTINCDVVRARHVLGGCPDIDAPQGV